MYKPSGIRRRRKKEKKGNRNLGLGDRFLLHLQCIFLLRPRYRQNSTYKVTHAHVFYTHMPLIRIKAVGGVYLSLYLSLYPSPWQQSKVIPLLVTHTHTQ